MEKWKIIFAPGIVIEIEADDIRRSTDGKCWTIKSNGSVVGEVGTDMAVGYFLSKALPSLDENGNIIGGDD